MGKVTVNEYGKQDGTRVKKHSRNDPRARGSSEEPNPEERYEVEATVKGETDGGENIENMKVTEVKFKPKEGGEKKTGE